MSIILDFFYPFFFFFLFSSVSEELLLYSHPLKKIKKWKVMEKIKSEKKENALSTKENNTGK